MPTALDLAGEVVLALLDERLGHGRDFGDRAVQPQRRVDVVREQIAGHAAARDGDVEAPEPFAALRQVGGDGPVLQELGAVMEDASELPLVDELLDHRDGRDAAVVVPDRVRHAGLLDRGGHRLRFLRGPPERLLAHHHLAGLRRRDGDVVMRVVRAGDVDDVDVLAADQLAPVRGVRLVAPVGGELLDALFVARRHRLQHRLVTADRRTAAPAGTHWSGSGP